MRMKYLRKAIKIIGSQSRLAKKLNLKHQSTVANWLARGKVPAKHCIAIEEITDGLVTRYDLRPDVFYEVNKRQLVKVADTR